jgi:hypothetical protein
MDESLKKGRGRRTGGEKFQILGLSADKYIRYDCGTYDRRSDFYGEKILIFYS